MDPVEADEGLVVEYINDVRSVIDAQDDPGIPGVGNEPAAKPTGVEVDHANVPPETCFDDGLGQQDTPLTQETTPIQAPPTMPVPEDSTLPCQGMTTQNARVRKPPEKYIPSMKGKKYAITMTQIAESLKDSKNAMAMTQMSVKLMSSGVHRKG